MKLKSNQDTDPYSNYVNSHLVPAEGGEREEPAVAPAPDGGAVGVDVGEVALQPLGGGDRGGHLHSAETLVHAEPPLVALKKCVFKPALYLPDYLHSIRFIRETMIVFLSY